jgi:hypothetical protein
MNQSEASNIATQEARLSQLAGLVNLGIRVLSSQALTILALLLDAGLFGWALETESWIRVAGATLFAVAAWCLIYLRPRSGVSQ